jgi:hypothetical protein
MPGPPRPRIRCQREDNRRQYVKKIKVDVLPRRPDYLAA